MNEHLLYFAGVDVQIQRGLAYCVLDRDAEYYTSGWIDVHEFRETAENLHELFCEMCGGDVTRLAVGIDAPRMPLPGPRPFYWEARHNTWRHRRPSDKGFGRHCEVVLKSLNLGNIQWTPYKNAPEWMKLGFSLYDALSDFEYVYEVFPSAVYRLLNFDTTTRMNIPLAQFLRGPKDMLDAAAAALSVLEFERGFGKQIGGGDGLGTIVLPRKLTIESAVKIWPARPFLPGQKNNF